jgi:CcmD family protein
MRDVLSLVLLAALSLPAPIVAAQGAAAPLVSVGEALSTSGPVLVAVTVDRATVAAREVGGVPGVGFTARGPSGAELPVELVGKLPAGFEVAPVVVLEGTAVGGRFLADRVLLAGSAQAAAPARGLKGVLAVTMVVWVGLFLYVFMLDRRLRRMEES